MKISEPLKKLFQHHIEKANYHFNEGSKKIKKNKNLLPLIQRAHLGLKWCDLISKEQFPLFMHQVELTPLRKWWHCRQV